MAALGRAKQRIGRQLQSAATAGEGTQNLLCAYMAAGVLAGLLANVTAHAWWLDPLVALGIAALAVHEGIDAWRGSTPGRAGTAAERVMLSAAEVILLSRSQQSGHVPQQSPGDHGVLLEQIRPFGRRG